MPSDLHVMVRVPATSANLGPGFDCLGLALSLYTTFEVDSLSPDNPTGSGPAIEIHSSCGDEWAIGELPTDHRNLFYQSFATHLADLGMPIPAIKVRITVGIPPGRGLGSSATAVVGGILAAQAFAGCGTGRERRGELLGAAVNLERGHHPDNVAAALLGGLVVTARDEQSLQWRQMHLPVPVRLGAVLFIPDIPMDTIVGRALLPLEYKRADAVHNIGHVALLVASLSRGDMATLDAAMDDRCHEPYRAQMFPELPDFLKAARAAGAKGACLSGGGSTILALTTNREHEIVSAFNKTAEALQVRGRSMIVKIDRRGARVSSGFAEAATGATVTSAAVFGPSVTTNTALAAARVVLACPVCGSQFSISQPVYRCSCGQPLDALIGDPGAGLSGPAWRRRFDQRLGSQEKLDQSGVWRFRELLLSVPGVVPVSRPEGQTNCYPTGREQEASGHGRIGHYVGLDQLWIKHEGENPTGSFKDRGMTVAVSIARWLGATAVACASTGNTSASMAAYAAQAGLRAIVLLPAGKVTAGKLSQAIAYGAEIHQIAGDFDQAMASVEQMCLADGCHLLNSLNPFRILGQQSLAFELMQQLGWDAPDWIALPAGNLGNTAAVGMGLLLAHRLGLIARLPRLAAVQASGANPFYLSFQSGFQSLEPITAHTVATAINIGNPVSFRRASQAILATRGVVTQVCDHEILQAKAIIDRAGIGCEPASAVSIAGLHQLVREAVISPKERVVAILTGNLLKDPASVQDAQDAVGQNTAMGMTRRATASGEEEEKE